MHQQPVSSCRVRGGKVAERLFEQGLCPPSGSSLAPAEREMIAGEVLKMRR